MFVSRTEFDYDPSKDPSIPGDRGLAFRAGDVLYVTNAADDSWWQAKRLSDGQDEEELGIIPCREERTSATETRQFQSRKQQPKQHIGSREEEKEEIRTLRQEWRQKRCAIR